MKRSEAPREGWYPDPRRPTRLRWWDGSDWTDHFRALPQEYELERHARLGAAAGSAFEGDVGAEGGYAARATGLSSQQRDMGGLRRADAEEIISQVRQVARSEVERAADLFTNRARSMTREIEPLVSQYTSKFLRWIKIAVVIAVLLLVAYIVFQVVVQASFFEWLGDRIDNLTDDT